MRTLPYSGFSDHSGHVLTGAVATAGGARIIEVHFRLDSTDPANPDYGHSLSPEQLIQYVQNVRFAEAAMGNGVKKMQPSERRWARYRVIS
jgi:sialic acid synthase SpsE